MSFRGEFAEHAPAHNQTDAPSRRRFLLGTTATTGLILTGGLLVEDLQKQERHKPIIFSPDQYGLNLNYRNFYQYKLNPKDILPKLLRFPGNHVRVAIYPDVIFRNGSTPDFSDTDALFDQCIAAGKKLHIVFGTKTTGGDEFNLSPYFKKSFPHTKRHGAVIGATEAERKILREEVGLIAQHYLADRNYTQHIFTAQRTNEGLSEHLEVTDKTVDKDWYVEEYDLVQHYNSYDIPIVQNIPIDTPENIPLAMQYCDIPGINVYPQSWRSYLGRIGDVVAQAHFWASMDNAFSIAKSNENETPEGINGFVVTEAQVAPWLSSDLTPKYPYRKTRVMDTMRRIKNHDPKIVFVWDLEQHYKNGDNEFIEALHALSS